MCEKHIAGTAMTFSDATNRIIVNEVTLGKVDCPMLQIVWSHKRDASWLKLVC